MHAAAIEYEALSDLDLARLAAGGDAGAVRLITLRNNQRLFRAAWSILKNRAEAEECVQDAYLQAFAGRAQFDGRSSLATWLTRIALNQALMRKRAAARRKRAFDQADVALLDDYRERFMSAGSILSSPESQLMRAELGKALESAIAKLPEEFRVVLILRDVEGLSVDEAAAALDIPAATIKTRHLRARRRLQQMLDPDFSAALAETLRFDGENCARMTARAVAALCPDDKR